jgi:hypothetical protein
MGISPSPDAVAASENVGRVAHPANDAATSSIVMTPAVMRRAFACICMVQLQRAPDTFRCSGQDALISRG